MKVYIPNRREIYANSLIEADSWAKNRKINLSNQRKIRFMPEALREYICQLIGEPMQGQKAVVLAGFTGEYSYALHKAGFNVLHTDILDCYVEAGRKKGLKAIKTHAENPPKLEDISFYTTFEFAPIHSNKGGEILMLLETLANSKHGLIETSLWDSRIYWEHLRPIYNFNITTIKGSIARYKEKGWREEKVTGYVTRYSVDDKFREILSTDLKVMDALQGPETNSIRRLAEKLMLKIAIVRESLNRITTTAGLGKNNEQNPTFIQLKLF
ncbi:MAG: hypothetical protein QW112_01920 [Candidatus Micrarchaeia archaeon]